MTKSSTADFERQYQTHLKHLKLKGLQPNTIDAYSRAIRRMGEYFDHRIDALTETQLIDYYADLVDSHSWSTVRHNLYGLKFYYEHVLKKPWVAPNLIKPPKSQRLPDIVTGPWCRTPAATATVRTASTTRANNGWNGRCGDWCRQTIS